MDEQTTSEGRWLANGWSVVRCGECGGHGMVCDYGRGEDFYGAKECSACDGSGHLWQSAFKRLALYPGGPFRGSIPRPS